MKIQSQSKKTSTDRVIFYSLILGLLPAILVIFNFYFKNKELEGVCEKINSVHKISETKVRKQYLNTIVRNIYCDVDQFYLENQVEPLSFLSQERERLVQLFQSPTFTGNEAAEKRYFHITSGANRMAFMQASPTNNDGVQEMVCMLSHPVEIDMNDLKEILNRLEGSRKGKPQLLITDLKLNKKTNLNGNETYELNLKLKKREFHL